MAIMKCPECNKMISDKATTCPQCGFVIKKRTSIITWVIAFFSFLFLAWFVAGLSQFNEPTTKRKAGLSIPSLGKQLVTFAEYKKIKDGMSVQEVASIIGAQGEEMSRNKMDGIKGVQDPIETIMFQWVNRNGSNMNAIFQNDRLIQKAQFGLK